MMDRALKERIIGAVVLVVFVVLVVPVFLDGPPPADQTVSQRVPLPGQSEQTTQTIVLERDRDEPVPAAASADTAPSAPAQVARDVKPPPPESKAEATPAPETVVAKATTTRKPPVDPSPPAANVPVSSATGMWAVQLGSFSNQDNAERLAADLRKQGFAAFLSKLSTDSSELVRVRVGPQKDRDSAQAMAEHLSRAGHAGQVVPHP